MTERLEMLLNRKPSKWASLSMKTFSQDIQLMQSTIREQRQEMEKLQQQLEVAES
ncbi:hypothetical protein [Ectobacillus funiculus]|uniref:hypothetical protein n=1 Tax=Ectobacillus funiculus TaxID=137993 RepID=UPI0036D2B402